MPNYELKKVETKKDIRAFLDMPELIYKDDDVWVRPLDNDIEAVFSPKKNHLFDEGEAIRWILYADGKPVGRIAAFYNRHKAAKSEQPTGGCGFFECIDSQEAANIMFDAAKEWLAERGMKAMDGPINFGDRDMFWGCEVEGFQHPMYGMNHHRPYYSALFENYGFQNYFNQYSHSRKIDTDTCSKNMYAKAERLKENPDYCIRHIDKKDIKGLGQMVRNIYNKAWANFTGVEEMSVEQADALEKQMKPIIDPRLIYIAQYQGETIGFFIMLPDVNSLTKDFHGKFGLINKLRFMYRLKTGKCTRINAIIFGVTPEFQGKGIESGLIKCCEDTIGSGKTNYNHLELVWIGDFNPLMIKMVETYVVAQKYKRHVTYRYMIDPEIEFTRAPKVSMSRKPKNPAEAAQ